MAERCRCGDPGCEGWELVIKAMSVMCPDCAFVFSYDCSHEDGSFSCPKCKHGSPEEDEDVSDG